MIKKNANYIAIIDWKAETKLGFSYVALDATDMLSAMTAVNNLWTEDVWLIDIAEIENVKSTDGLYGEDSRTWYWIPKLESRSWNHFGVFEPGAIVMQVEQSYFTADKIWLPHQFSRRITL